MGSLPGLLDLLPLVTVLQDFDSLSLNMVGSISDSIGVTIPETDA